MQPAYIVIVAVFAAVVAALLVVVLLRRGWSIGSAAVVTTDRLSALESELLAVREAKGDLERRVAVEEERSSRVPALEQALAEKSDAVALLGQAKATVEAQLATSTEGLARVEVALQDLRARLALAELSRDAIRELLDGVRGEKSHLEETLAAKVEATTRMEAVIEDFRGRLDATGQTCTQLTARVEALAREKGELESTITEKSTLLSAEIAISAKLGTRLDQTTALLESASRDIGDLRTRLAALQETLDQERKQAGEKVELLTDAKERMTQEFKLLAGEVMQLHGENFSKQNKEQIETILAPLREKLGEFQQGIQVAQTESTKERATLAEQIRQLTESSAKMTTETSSLTRALKGEAQTQGAWGEMILDSILEKSGLREGEDYVTQQSHATEDGQKVRPDVVVNLPGGQRIVIDSKLSLTAFDGHVNAETDIERAETLARHLTSMRSHVRTLSNKEYHSVVGGQIDYVIMFVPIEAALAAALRGDPNLTAYAVENNVAIATPTMLMMALRTVRNVWQVERRNRNAEAIAERAGRLYDKLVGFVEDMNALGNRLNQARGTYDAAMGKLSSGSGNLIRQVEQLKGLGARTSKSLPANLLGDEEVEALPAPEAADTAS